uniref:Conotoxin n=1 Tax=Conus betulinus TaxID=89764 RepID=A0A142C1C6_CONBE|nr:conotoxin [Conus betulinus]
MTLSLVRSAVVMLVLLLAFDNFADVQPKQTTRGASSFSDLLSKGYRIVSCPGNPCERPSDCSRCSCNFNVCMEMV